MDTISSTPPLPGTERRILFLAFGATSSMIMGVSSIMPMVPSLARTFEVSQTTASLVITVFTLPGILFALLAGVLADRFGRRAVLVPSLLLFSLAGAACSLADSFGTLLCLRFLQGMGAAPLGVLNATIIADTWSGRDMSTRIGYNMTILNVGTALYPSIGGSLALIHWRLPFLLPLLVLPVFFVALGTPLANPGFASSLGQYVHGVGKLFKTRTIAGLLGITALTFLLLYGPIITCLPVLADSRFASSPAAIGGAMAFSSLGAGLTASRLGRLYAVFSPRFLLLLSQGLYAISLVSLAAAPSLAWTIPAVLLFGIGQGMNIPNVQSQLLSATSAAQRASVMAVNGMLLRLGQSLAPVCFSLIMVRVDVDWGFYLGIALATLIALLAVFFVPRGNRA